ncbi:MAG: hypothetical protein QOH21_3029 [Acidobacteriota bacterium]|jgi:hypothetical protein|nr:hypothetical protein [Acidobacteriota bacterium]
MAVRGEEVASSIDAHVREEIDRMVAEIRSSVEDVRGVVDSQLKAALQSMQADVKAITFLPHVRKVLGELEESYAAGQPAAAASSGSDAGRVKRAIQQVERGKSQVDVLNALLDQCLEFGSRAALLILKGETFSGWKGAGFSAQGGNDETIKRFNAAPGLIPELDLVLRNEQVVHWDGANLSTRFGVAASTTAVLVPMVIKDKVAAAVYVDATDTDLGKFDSSAIELLVFTTGLLIDTLAIRKKIPSPSLSDDSGDAPSAAPAAVPSAPAPAAAPQAAAPAPRPTPPPAAPAPAPRPPAPAPAAPATEEAASATVAISAAQLREMMAAQRPSFNVPSADDFGGGGTATPAPAAPPAPSRLPSLEMPMPKPAPPPAPVAPPPPAAPAAPAAPEERASTQFIPPPGLSRGGVLGTPQNEDAKKHDEARRFARLLVSEIKLYNESKVDQGRRNKDLYERLKEDIDRSRQMYDERIGEDVRKTSNYFYDELVRILADGRADVLGL